MWSRRNSHETSSAAPVGRRRRSSPAPVGRRRHRSSSSVFPRNAAAADLTDSTPSLVADSDFDGSETDSLGRSFNDSLLSLPVAEPWRRGATSSSSSSIEVKLRRKRVSFASSVDVKIVPHASSLRFSQRHRMYASSEETERNLERNEKEFWFDGYDWRNATEEQDMKVDPVTGELVHPAHAFEFGDQEQMCEAEWDRESPHGDHGSALWL